MKAWERRFLYKTTGCIGNKAETGSNVDPAKKM